MGNPITGKFETLDCWKENQRPPGSDSWDPALPCNVCTEATSTNKNSIHLCTIDSKKYRGQIYSLIISRLDLPVTMLKFRLKESVSLTQDESKVFRNIGDEIAVALLAGRAQKRISELQSAEIAMAERRMVSAYVHDNLGQNLGYLHLKLDQLGKDENFLRSKNFLRDLNHLREVANDSYEMVRELLKKMQPETIPNLTNLMKEWMCLLPGVILSLIFR
jgi:nitrate/nitrite-specific signal transduction histidine kinase